MRTLPGATARSLLPVALATLAISCAGGGGRPSPELLPMFPPPPDTARFQFLTSISSLDDVAGRGGPSFLQRLVGARREPSPVRIQRPYGVAAGKGRIYVCDVDLPGVDVIDLESRTMRQAVSPQLQQPTGCDVDAVTGDLYVVDVQRGDVPIIGADGIFAGAIQDSLRAPGDVVVAEDRVWVTDLTTRQVRVYDRATRRHLFAFPERGLEPDAPGVLARPMNLAVGRGEVYVSDQFARRVQVYSTAGEFLRTIGGPGQGFGQFDVPKGVAIDEQGLVYVADFFFHHIQVFDREGRLLTLLAGGGGYRGPGFLGGPIDIEISSDNLEYFRRYVRPGFDLQYLIMVTNQLSPDKLTIYGYVGPRVGT